jgi:hypothetical protein
MTLADLLPERRGARFLRGERFFDVPRTTRSTSEGAVALPILYHEVANVVALFHVSRDGAEGLLEGTGLAPQLAPDGRALAALSFYEYRRTSIGPYNEVGTTLLVRPQGARPSRLGIAEMFAPPRWRKGGAYVVDLPVTTAAASAAGREIWGYPKFITDISFRLAGRELACSVFDPDSAPQGQRERILALRGRLGPGLPAPPMGIVTFSVLDRMLWRTDIDVRGSVMVHTPGSVQLEVGPSRHRMAENLRTLGLTGTRPILVIETERFQSRLPAGAACSPSGTGDFGS